MSIQIKDGTGTGKIARVDAFNKLDVNRELEDVRLLRSGNAYNYNTLSVNLTSDTESGVMYVKNNEVLDIYLDRIFYLLGASTGGSGDILLNVYKNPTEGTLISAGTDQVPENRNFGSNKTLAVDAKKGAEGLTITDGLVAVSSLFNLSGRYVVDFGGLFIPAGRSIAISVTPPVGNTSMDIQVAIPMVLQVFSE